MNTTQSGDAQVAHMEIMSRLIVQKRTFPRVSGLAV